MSKHKFYFKVFLAGAIAFSLTVYTNIMFKPHYIFFGVLGALIVVPVLVKLIHQELKDRKIVKTAIKNNETSFKYFTTCNKDLYAPYNDLVKSFVNNNKLNPRLAYVELPFVPVDRKENGFWSIGTDKDLAKSDDVKEVLTKAGGLDDIVEEFDYEIDIVKQLSAQKIVAINENIYALKRQLEQQGFIHLQVEEFKLHYLNWLDLQDKIQKYYPDKYPQYS